MPRTINIFKNEGRDCSNGGLSSRCNEALAFGPNEPFDRAALAAARKHRYVEAIRIMPGNVAGSIIARPIDPVDGGTPRGMFGGCFVYCGDDSFGRMVAEAGGHRYIHGALALHDRFE